MMFKRYQFLQNIQKMKENAHEMMFNLYKYFDFITATMYSNIVDNSQQFKFVSIHIR